MKKSNKKPTIKKTNPKKNSKIIVDVYVPKFDDLWNNHPSILKIKACEEKIGNTNKYIYANQCAISLSYTLKKCNVNLGSFTGNLCACSYVRGAEDLANWLNQKKPFGDKVKSITMTFEELEKNKKKGIIFLKDFWRRPGESFEKRSGDHIDLINGTKLTAARILTHENLSGITRAASSAIRLANRVADRIANRPESSNSGSESDEEPSWVISPYAESKSILFWELE